MDRFFFSFLTILCVFSAACTETRRAPGRTEGMNAGECSDGADNDGDRLYDCGDPDCAGAPACEGVVIDSGVGDAGPRDTGTVTDTGVRRDTAVPPSDSGTADTRARMCDDVTGTWENVMECPLLAEGELVTISALGDCEFEFSWSGTSGTGTLDGSMVTFGITMPVPVTCEGTYTPGVITSDCLGCVIELHQL